MNMKFEINREECIKCGLCIKDCVTDAIEQDNQGFPQMTSKDSCINCQHCFAICPKGAIKFDENEAQNAESTNYDDILSLIKSRRSVRQYKHENVSEEKLSKLKAMLKYIPTGCNSHSLHFSVVEDLAAMDEIRDKVNSKILNSFVYKIFAPIFNKFSKTKDALKNGEDIIFRNAPHMIVVSSPVTAPCATEDPIIALSYFELYAQHLGLGTCWCGFGQISVKLFPEICDILQIPKGYVPVGVMLFGEPAIKYQRIIQPKPYVISSVKGDFKTHKRNIFEVIIRFITNFLR